MDAARRRIFGLGIILVSLAIFLWGSWPTRRGQRDLNITLPTSQSSGLSSEVGPAETVRLRFEWPERLRIGDSQKIRLTLELSNTKKSVGTRLGQQNDYNQLLEGHLELEGILPDPNGDITAPIKPGETSVFEWTLHPRWVGEYNGTLWVHVRFVSQDDGIEKARRVLTAQRFKMKSNSILGLEGKAARLAGISGVIAGIMIFLETFLEGFWRSR